ncbi:NAD(P)-binding protein [Hyaloscypha variabilis]|uniref:NAD(P)-binding protein n=1 Tax=Hyaloscypha variabilis (strain UAMH 11265 / GT02V1 / F) TaxID=1149755 RepID=A0A2J6RZ22_HYAVF|nr:NAD(P)-binding protein [Hyaloscypha variabilis F]
MSRTIVVTGAARGLGLEWVRQLSLDPQNFIVAVVRNPSTSTLLQPLLGPKVVVVKADLEDFDSFPQIAAEIAKVGGGKIDVLINNAGVMTGAGASFSDGISKSTPAEWDNQFRINVTAQVFFTLALLPLLEKGTEKKVVNVTSMLGDLTYSAENPHLQFASYSASKAGITMANLKFHNEFKEKGFVFLALNPGWVNTDLAGEGMGNYAPLQVDDSIRQCLSFVNRATAEHSGKFWSLDGRPEAVVQ